MKILLLGICRNRDQRSIVKQTPQKIEIFQIPSSSLFCSIYLIKFFQHFQQNLRHEKSGKTSVMHTSLWRLAIDDRKAKYYFSIFGDMYITKIHLRNLPLKATHETKFSLICNSQYNQLSNSPIPNGQKSVPLKYSGPNSY